MSQAQLSGLRASSSAGSAKAMAGARAAVAISAALPRSTLMEYGGGAAGGGALGGGVQGAVGVLTPNGTPMTAVPAGACATGDAMGSAPGGSVNLPGLESGGNQFAFGASLGQGGAMGLTNAVALSQLAGSSTAYSLNTPAGSFQFSMSDSGVWTATVGTPAVGLSFSKQEVNTEILIEVGVI